MYLSGSLLWLGNARERALGPPTYHRPAVNLPLTIQDQDQVILLVATNLRAQAEFNPRAFHGVVAAPDASVYRRRKSPVTGLPLPQQRGGRE